MSKIILNFINIVGLSIGYYMSKYMDYLYSYQRNGEGIFLYFIGVSVISVFFLFLKKDVYKNIFPYIIGLEVLSVFIILISPETGDAYFQIQKKTVALFMVFILSIFCVSMAIYKTHQSNKNII